MPLPPMVCGLGLTIHRPFDIAIEGRLLSASSIASPYMLAIIVDFVFEGVIDCDIEACY